MTPAEEVLWMHLRKKRLRGLRFRRQHPIDIFIADFYCHQYRLVIELDGQIHSFPEASEYDNARTGELNRLGISVLRFTNQQVHQNISHVLKTIVDFIKTHSCPSPPGEGLGWG